MPKCAFGQSQVGSTLWQIRMPSDATVLPSASGVLFMANASISGEDGVISVTIHLTERINLIRSQPLQSMDWFILVYIGLHWQEAMFFPIKHGGCSCWCSLQFEWTSIIYPEDVTFTANNSEDVGLNRYHHRFSLQVSDIHNPVCSKTKIWGFWFQPSISHQYIYIKFNIL